MTISCHDATIALGVYVVGALDRNERAEVEAHLNTCPACRDELAALAPLPGFMSRLSLGEVEAGPPPVDDAMLERLLVRAARDRRTASHRRWLAVAAAVVVLAGGTAGGVTAWDATHHSSEQRISAQRGDVHFSVLVADDEGGTRLDMAMSGVAAGERCSVIAVDRQGHSEVAGWWKASYEGTAHVTGTTSIPRDQLVKVKVVTSDGRTLVAVPV